MGLFGIGALFLGYSAFYYGYNRITGGNDTFVSLVWPGKYKPTARDDGSGGSPAANPITLNPKSLAQAASGGDLPK